MLFFKQNVSDITSILFEYAQSFSDKEISQQIKHAILMQLSRSEYEKFAFVFSILFQARMFLENKDHEFFNELVQSDISNLSNIVQYIVDHHLLQRETIGNSQQILNVLIKHKNFSNLIAGIKELTENHHHLLIRDFSTVIWNALLHSENPRAMSRVLICLKDHCLMSHNNINSMVKCPSPQLFAVELKKLLELRIPTNLMQEIIPEAAVSKRIIYFCGHIKRLHEGHHLDITSIRNVVDTCKFKDDLSIFRKMCPSPLRFFLTSPSNQHMDSSTDLIEPPIDNLSELLTLCRQS